MGVIDGKSISNAGVNESQIKNSDLSLARIPPGFGEALDNPFPGTYFRLHLGVVASETELRVYPDSKKLLLPIFCFFDAHFADPIGLDLLLNTNSF